jgi:hypothetical protein
MNDNLLQFFWKNSPQPSSSSNPISSSFLVHFEWFKSRWVCQPRLYKTSLYSKAKDAIIKDLKLRILICFHSLVIEHWTPFTPNIPYLAHSFTKLKDFFDVGNVRWRLNMFFELQNWNNNVWGFNLVWVFKCSFTNLSTLIDTQCFSKIFSICEYWISFFQINGIGNEFMKISKFIWIFFDIVKLNEWMKIY